MKRLLVLLIILTQLTAALAQQEHGRVSVLALPDSQRVQQVAAMLADKPTGFGKSYQQREVWNQLKARKDYQDIIKRAEGLIKQPFPEWNDADYLKFYENGSRSEGEKMMSARAKWLPVLTWAECLENKGRFVPAIEMAIGEYIKQKSWVLPAHDYGKKNFTGTTYFVDLVSADMAQNLAQALYLLNDKLKPALQQQLINELDKRIFKPVMVTLATNSRDNRGWLLTTNNWNAVCLSGVTGAAMAALPNKTDRAKFAVIAETYSVNSIAGFTDDGYCSEGMGYYDYGFSHYIRLRELLYQTTGGKIDLFSGEKIRKIALYPFNIAITDNVYPTIADCKVGTKPYPSIIWYCNKVLGLGLQKYDTISFAAKMDNISENVMHAFPNSASRAKSFKTDQPQIGARSYFNNAGIIVVRPGKSTGILSASIKGGNNNEHHNHNDLGSYTLVAGQDVIVEDPGGPGKYSATTFGKDRYTIQCIASYGHPVPLIAGKQQLDGEKSQAKIVKTTFTDAQDAVVMDIKSAYPVPTLTNLIREFTYDRAGKGTFKVQDDFEFTTDELFETAIITRAKWKIIDKQQIEFSTASGKVRATIQSTAGAFSLSSETNNEEKPAYDRIAIRLNKPVKKGTITITYTLVP
jgi:hypothetical protein